jgi:hypothetical protein
MCVQHRVPPGASRRRGRENDFDKLTSQYLTHIMGMCKFGVVKEEPSV